MTWRGKKIGRKLLRMAAVGLLATNLAYQITGSVVNNPKRNPLSHRHSEAVSNEVDEFVRNAGVVLQAAAQGNYSLAVSLRDSLEASWTASGVSKLEINALKQLGPLLRELMDVQVEINNVLDDGLWTRDEIGGGTMINAEVKYLKALNDYFSHAKGLSPDVRRVLEPWLASRHAELVRRLDGIHQNAGSTSLALLISNVTEVTNDFVATP